MSLTALERKGLMVRKCTRLSGAISYGKSPWDVMGDVGSSGRVTGMTTGTGDSWEVREGPSDCVTGVSVLDTTSNTGAVG